MLSGFWCTGIPGFPDYPIPKVPDYLTLTCMRASREPSGSSTFPANGASITA